MYPMLLQNSYPRKGTEWWEISWLQYNIPLWNKNFVSNLNQHFLDTNRSTKNNIFIFVFKTNLLYF
jgi:hypothetical protein